MDTRNGCQPICARMSQNYVEGPRTLHVSKTIARLVPPIPARLAVAPYQGSLSHLAFGNHAAADACCRRDSLLREVSSAIPGRSLACRCSRGRSTAPLVRPRLLQPGTQATKSRG